MNKKITVFILSSALIFSMSGCKTEQSDESVKSKDPVPSTEAVSEPVTLTMFAASYEVKEKNTGNEIMDIITKKTGVNVREVGIVGTMNTSHLADDMINAAENLPDLLYLYDAHKLYENGLLVAWDPYLEKYPELKALHSDEEWDQLRQSDGHIYWADFADSQYQKDTTVYHEGEAFWIQVRVLEWAGYPEIETLDEYFDLLEAYADANPEMPDESEVIPYSCYCFNLGYRTMGMAPAYLAGYPENGGVIIDVSDGDDNPKVVDYNTSDSAKSYFKKLNEEYHNGNVDPGFAKDLYHDNLNKIEAGRVLGFFGKYRNIEKVYIKDAFSKTLKLPDGSKYKLEDLGCDYVPLALVNEKGMDQQYHSYNVMISDTGLMVTKKCKDPDKAFEFFNEILSQDLHDLRFWGIEGTDYLIDSDGSYYRTEEMRANWQNESYIVKHVCDYRFLPHWHGMSRDGINRMLPAEQPSEFRAELTEHVTKCLDAYEAGNYVDMLGSVNCDPYPWYPLSTWTDELESLTTVSYGKAWKNIDDCKSEWFPRLIMSDDFESEWDGYLSAYEECNPGLFIDAAMQEVNNRLT